MASTEAQKEANKRYREKHKPIQLTVQYKTDKIEGLRFKQYLNDNGLKANDYLKKLIKQDMDSKGVEYIEAIDNTDTIEIIETIDNDNTDKE